MIALFSLLLFSGSCELFLPVTPGTTWIYRGTAAWTAPGAAESDSGPIAWTMSVEHSRRDGGTQLALVRGFVHQLAWWEPGRTPALALLICRDGQLYLAGFEHDSLALRAYQEPGDVILSPELWAAVPFTPDRILGQDPPRDDTFYGWLIEPVAPAPLPPGCARGNAPAARLTYRTLPDHRIVDWLPGTGITRFQYAHHGTTANADVRLVECRR